MLHSPNMSKPSFVDIHWSNFSGCNSVTLYCLANKMVKLWLMAFAVTRRHQLRWFKKLVWRLTWDLKQNRAAVNQLKAMQFFTCCGSKRVSAHFCSGVHSSKWPYICIKFDPLPKNGWHLKMTPEKNKHIHHNFSRQDPTKRTNHQHRTTAPKKTSPCYTAWTPDPVIFMNFMYNPYKWPCTSVLFETSKGGVWFLPYLYNWWSPGPTAGRCSGSQPENDTKTAPRRNLPGWRDKFQVALYSCPWLKGDTQKVNNMKGPVPIWRW